MESYLELLWNVPPTTQNKIKFLYLARVSSRCLSDPHLLFASGLPKRQLIISPSADHFLVSNQFCIAGLRSRPTTVFNVLPTRSQIKTGRTADDGG
ncbi:hypothetical protein T265_15940, partial [Opisthorchis viverrini]